MFDIDDKLTLHDYQTTPLQLWPIVAYREGNSKGKNEEYKKSSKMQDVEM